MKEAATKSSASVYFWLCIPGALLPLSQFLPWAANNGLNPSLFISDLFSNQIGGFFGWDVIVSSIVLIVFIVIENRKGAISGSHWAILGTFLVGVSFGLPLFLGLRERARTKPQMTYSSNDTTGRSPYGA